MARHPGRHPGSPPSPPRGARHPSEPVRITTAGASRADDIAARQRRYLIAMTFRTACFVAAILVTVTWARVLLVVGALVLPYIAVVMANAGSARSDEFALVNPPMAHPELPPAPDSATDSGPDHL